MFFLGLVSWTKNMQTELFSSFYISTNS